MTAKTKVNPAVQQAILTPTSLVGYVDHDAQLAGEAPPRRNAFGVIISDVAPVVKPAISAVRAEMEAAKPTDAHIDFVYQSAVGLYAGLIDTSDAVLMADTINKAIGYDSITSGLMLEIPGGLVDMIAADAKERKSIISPSAIITAPTQAGLSQPAPMITAAVVAAIATIPDPFDDFGQGDADADAHRAIEEVKQTREKIQAIYNEIEPDSTTEQRRAWFVKDSGGYASVADALIDMKSGELLARILTSAEQEADTAKQAKQTQQLEPQPEPESLQTASMMVRSPDMPAPLSKASAPMTITTGDVQWDTLVRQAETIHASGFFPQIKKAADAITLGLMAQALRVPLITAINGIDLIQGKPTLKPQFQLSMVRASGLMESIQIDPTDTICKVTIKRKGQAEYAHTFSMADANAMQLTGKDNWKKQPKVMLMWRCVAAVLRIVFPDVIQGFYSTEEIYPDSEFVGGMVV